MFGRTGSVLYAGHGLTGALLSVSGRSHAKSDAEKAADDARKTGSGADAPAGTTGSHVCNDRLRG